jgi:hypothetical protein
MQPTDVEVRQETRDKTGEMRDKRQEMRDELRREPIREFILQLVKNWSKWHELKELSDWMNTYLSDGSNGDNLKLKEEIQGLLHACEDSRCLTQWDKQMTSKENHQRFEEHWWTWANPGNDWCQIKLLEPKLRSDKQNHRCLEGLMRADTAREETTDAKLGC